MTATLDGIVQIRRLPDLTSSQSNKALRSVWAAVSDELAGLGRYLADCAIGANVAPYAVDPQRAEQLWPDLGPAARLHRLFRAPG